MKEIEHMILRRNKHHLYQATVEKKTMSMTQSCKILSPIKDVLVDQLLSGDLPLDEVTKEEVQAWLSAVQHTATKMTLPRIHGAISVTKF